MGRFTEIIEKYKADLEAINKALVAKEVGEVNRFSEIADKIRAIETEPKVATVTIYLDSGTPDALYVSSGSKIYYSCTSGLKFPVTFTVDKTGTFNLRYYPPSSATMPDLAHSYNPNSITIDEFKDYEFHVKYGNKKK